MNSCWINAKWNKNNTLFGSVKGTEPFFQPCMDTETHIRCYGFPFRIAKLRFVPVGLGFPVTAQCRLCLFGKAAREKCQTAQIWPKVPGWQITICLFIEELFFPPKITGLARAPVALVLRGLGLSLHVAPTCLETGVNRKDRCGFPFPVQWWRCWADVSRGSCRHQEAPTDLLLTSKQNVLCCWLL